MLVEDTEIDTWLKKYDNLFDSYDISNVKMAFIMASKDGFINSIFDVSDLTYMRKYIYSKKEHLMTKISWNIRYRNNYNTDVSTLIGAIHAQIAKVNKIEIIKNRNLKRIYERNAKTL